MNALGGRSEDSPDRSEPGNEGPAGSSADRDHEATDTSGPGLPTGWYLPGIVDPREVPAPGPVEQGALGTCDSVDIPWDLFRNPVGDNHSKATPIGARARRKGRRGDH